MNETIKVIMGRRSIRQYQEKQIGDKEIEAIMEAAIHAPSAMNAQRWYFAVVQNKVLLDRMVDIIKENVMSSGPEMMKQRVSDPKYHTFYHAPTVVMIFADEKHRFGPVDCALAAENIALAAESLGIGSCVMTSPGLLFASEKGNALKKELGVPEGYNFVCAVALGYMSGAKPATPPRNRDVIRYIR
jgi:nitroreductase